MLGGEKKTLKTYVAVVFMLALASGRKAFDHFEVPRAVPVMVYVGEGGRIPYTERLERVAKAMGVKLEDVPLFTSFDTAPVMSEKFQTSLRRDLEETGAEATFLDPLYSFHGSDADARNLHDEGQLLNSISQPCSDAGSSLTVVNHFNKTGNGRGLDRLTMAGGAEWCDSWWLLSHREIPNVAAGEFQLLLEVGSRRWGGMEYDLDFKVGKFDVDRGEFVGDMSWDIRPHDAASSGGDLRGAVLSVVGAQPFEYTKEELAKRVGGRLTEARRMVNFLDEIKALESRLVERHRTDGRRYKAWVFGPTSEPGRDRTADDAL